MAAPTTMARAALTANTSNSPALGVTETPDQEATATTPTSEATTTPETPETPTAPPTALGPKADQFDTTVSGNLQSLLDEGGAYLTQARQQGAQQAAARGLGNSSIAAQSAQGQAIGAAAPIAQQDAANELSKWRLGATVSSNLQGQYSQALNDILNQYSISVNQIETAQNISTADKNQMIENSIARRNADLEFLKNMYTAMPGFNTDWGLFPSAE